LPGGPIMTPDDVARVDLRFFETPARLLGFASEPGAPAGDLP
jgi:hypothetical protein